MVLFECSGSAASSDYKYSPRALMFTSVSRRSGSTGLDVFVSGLQRYRLLSAEDKRKLLGAHRLKVFCQFNA